MEEEDGVAPLLGLASSSASASRTTDTGSSAGQSPARSTTARSIASIANPTGCRRARLIVSIALLRASVVNQAARLPPRNRDIRVARSSTQISWWQSS